MIEIVKARSDPIVQLVRELLIRERFHDTLEEEVPFFLVDVASSGYEDKRGVQYRLARAHGFRFSHEVDSGESFFEMVVREYESEHIASICLLLHFLDSFQD